MQKIDVNLINPFINATNEALSMMAMCTPVRKGVKIKKDNVLSGDISGIMGLAGDVSGSIVITFQKETACLLVGNMLGMKYDDINSDVVDGIQEIVNLIAGQAKTNLKDTPYHFSISIPTCISGKNHQINHKEGVPCIAADFEVENLPFSVEVSISPKT